MAELPEAGRRSRVSSGAAQQSHAAGELCSHQTVSAIIGNKDCSTMSDHFSGPRALSEPAADITDVYAFPAPDSPDHLVLVLDVFGKAGPSAVFSDAVIYRFRIRPVEITSTGPEAAYAPGETEFTFDCTFDVPSGTGNAVRPVQYGRCLTPAGRVISFCS